MGREFDHHGVGAEAFNDDTNDTKFISFPMLWHHPGRAR
jgi:uncharacterized UPF0160 family protein